MREKIIEFKSQEPAEHQNFASASIAQTSLLDKIFTGLVKTGCKIAIVLSKKL